MLIYDEQHDINTIICQRHNVSNHYWTETVITMAELLDVEKTCKTMARFQDSLKIKR